MEKKKDIVKYDNKFNLTNLNILDKIEQDIFMTICSKITMSKKEKICIDLSELKTKSKLSSKKYSEERYLNFLKSTMVKLSKIGFSVTTPTSYAIMPIFSILKRSERGTELEVELNSHFVHYLYDIPEKIAFSMFELEMFLNLTSKYSKTLFRFLLQNFSGTWKVKIDELRELMLFPEKSRTSDFLKTLDNCVNEINDTNLINSLSYSFTYASKRGRPIDTITFTYKINASRKLELEGQTTITDFAEVSKVKKEAIKVIEQSHTDIKSNGMYDNPVIISVQTEEEVERCPHCNAEVIIKTSKAGNKYKCCKNNKYWKLGTADCDWTDYNL